MQKLDQFYAAKVRSGSKFCIAATNADDEDPVTALLAYDAAFPQPWRRVDVRRIISSITDYRAPGSTMSLYVALSGEGDVYFLDDQVRSEKISGAGLNSDDSTGLGAVNCIVQIEDLLYAR